MSEPSSTHAGAARIDRWLFAVRLAGSRVLAAAAVSGGRVHINGERVKAAHRVLPGDIVTFKRGSVEFECAVERIPLRRGPAREALLVLHRECGERGAPGGVCAQHEGRRLPGAAAAAPSRQARARPLASAAGSHLSPRASPQCMSGGS